MRYKTGDLVIYKGKPVIFGGIYIVIDVVLGCFTLKNIVTGSLFQADPEDWEKVS
jgi:hypothetical protein